MYKDAWESICEFLPASGLTIKYVKRGSTNRVRICRKTHVLIDYPYTGELTEVDYASLIAWITRLAFR